MMIAVRVQIFFKAQFVLMEENVAYLQIIIAVVIVKPTDFLCAAVVEADVSPHQQYLNAWNSTVYGFKKLDKDFSGDIDLQELLCDKWSTTIARLINFVFKSVDKNQDGHIYPEEMNAAH